MMMTMTVTKMVMMIKMMMMLMINKYLNPKVSFSLFQIFSGNSRSDQLMKHVLVDRPTARSVRFQPVSFSAYKALRVEVYGIKTPIGTSSWLYGDASLVLVTCTCHFKKLF